MRLLYLFLLTGIFTNQVFAVDPFVNPIKLKEERLKTLKKEVVQTEEASIFSSVILKPLDELSIQGVISSGNSHKLVLEDPSTGEVFILKEGEPISKNEKIVKITPEKVIIAVYKRQGRHLVKSYRILKVNLGGE
jgi:Tfp pilus assembly protein PilP